MKRIFTSNNGLKLIFSAFGFLMIHAVYAQSKHVVEVSNNKYEPKDLLVSVGDTVEWKNIQGWHNVNGTQTTFANNPESFGNGTGNGWTYTYVFTQSGVYNYQCDPHVNLDMVGTITVEQNSTQKHIVEVSNNVFTPDELKINVGDTVEWRNIQGWHNVNGTQETFPDNPESFGNSTGSGWTFSHVFKTEGKYDYQCDPHVNFDMIGKVEVKSAKDDNKHLLTINFSDMNPHVGQKLFLRVYEKNSGKEVERKVEDIDSNFAVQVSGIEKDHSYYIDFFADHNENGMYDAPNADHAWRLDLDNVMGDTTLNFTHNTNFTDIMWENKLTVHFTGMNPHVGQDLVLRIVEKNSGTEVFRTQTKVTPELSFYSYGIENGKSYNIDFYSDHNGNGLYDAPPTDHAWRLELNNVTGDTTLHFSHNINFTDIGLTTGIEDVKALVNRMYPNPAANKVTLDMVTDTKDFSVAIFDLTGKKQSAELYFGNGKVEVNLKELQQGIYFVQLTEKGLTQTLKLIKK